MKPTYNELVKQNATLVTALDNPEWIRVWTLFNAFASGKTQQTWSRAEPLAILGELYLMLANIHMANQAALAKGEK